MAPNTLRGAGFAVILGLVPVFIVLTPPFARAHDAIVDQIATLDHRIEKNPADATLYLRRGELRRMRAQWTEARDDYESARRIDPGLAAVDLCLGRMWIEAGDPARATAPLDRFLARRPDDPDALVTRARARLALGRHLEAADDFTRAISRYRGARGPEPDCYLERARALRAAGAGHVEQALRGLDEGLARLGQPVTLQLLAIDLEIESKNYDAALARLDRAAAPARRRESWLVRRADILERAGRLPEARQAYAQALAEVDALAGRRRGTGRVTRPAETSP